MGRLVDGLRHIADRANLPFDQVAAEISLLSQPDQVGAKIRTTRIIHATTDAAGREYPFHVRLGEKRTFRGAVKMSALGQKRTF
jgi:hypothetical protein